jgi:hypothetical protein
MINPLAKPGKRFFLKKEAKTFARLSPASPRQPRKSFLVLFFKKELLPYLRAANTFACAIASALATLAASASAK